MNPEIDKSVLFNKSRDKRWFTHGSLEFQFTPIVCKYKQIIFLTRVPPDNRTTYLTTSNLALVLSLDQKVSKDLTEISVEYNKWMKRIEEDFTISPREHKPLSKSLLYANISEIQSNLGFSIIKKEIGASWRLI